eukprot:scaffold171415_cov33-Tisochrysis_lutea.AAC.5
MQARPAKLEMPRAQCGIVHPRRSIRDGHRHGRNLKPAWMEMMEARRQAGSALCSCSGDSLLDLLLGLRLLSLLLSQKRGTPGEKMTAETGPKCSASRLRRPTG